MTGDTGPTSATEPTPRRQSRNPRTPGTAGHNQPLTDGALNAPSRSDRLPAVLDDPLGVLTVEEAAVVLRIGRGAAYAAARRWRATAGREGLPVIVLGRSLRVPAARLKQMLEDPTVTVTGNAAVGATTTGGGAS